MTQPSAAAMRAARQIDEEQEQMNDMMTVDGLAKIIDAEFRDVVRDAARYRWLREQHWNDNVMAVITIPKESLLLGSECPSLERLDVAIDGLMVKIVEVGVDNARRIEESAAAE